MFIKSMLPSSGPAQAQGAQSTPQSSHRRRARRCRDEEEYDVVLTNNYVFIIRLYSSYTFAANNSAVNLLTM